MSTYFGIGHAQFTTNFQNKKKEKKMYKFVMLILREIAGVKYMERKTKVHFISDNSTNESLFTKTFYIFTIMDLIKLVTPPLSM